MITIKLFDANVLSVTSAVSSVDGGGFDVEAQIIENEEWSEIGLHESDQTVWIDDVKIRHSSTQSGLPNSSTLNRISPRDKLSAAILQGAGRAVMEHCEILLGVTSEELCRAGKYDSEDEFQPWLTEDLKQEVKKDKEAFEKCKKALGDNKIVYRISGFCSWLGQEIKYLEETSSVLEVYRSSLSNLGISLTVTPYGLYLKPRPEQAEQETGKRINTSEEGDE